MAIVENGSGRYAELLPHSGFRQVYNWRAGIFASTTLPWVLLKFSGYVPTSRTWRFLAAALHAFHAFWPPCHFLKREAPLLSETLNLNKRSCRSGVFWLPSVNYGAIIPWVRYIITEGMAISRAGKMQADALRNASVKEVKMAGTRKPTVG